MPQASNSFFPAASVAFPTLHDTHCTRAACQNSASCRRMTFPLSFVLSNVSACTVFVFSQCELCVCVSRLHSHPQSTLDPVSYHIRERIRQLTGDGAGQDGGVQQGFTYKIANYRPELAESPSPFMLLVRSVAHYLPAFVGCAEMVSTTPNHQRLPLKVWGCDGCLDGRF